VVHVVFDKRHNNSCTISGLSVQGLGSYGTPISLFPIDSDHNHYRQ